MDNSLSLTERWVGNIQQLSDSGTYSDRLKATLFTPQGSLAAAFDGLVELGKASSYLVNGVYHLTIGSLVGSDPSTTRGQIRVVAVHVMRAARFFLEAIVMTLCLPIELAVPRVCVKVHETLHGRLVTTPSFASKGKKVAVVALAILVLATLYGLTSGKNTPKDPSLKGSENQQDVDPFCNKDHLNNLTQVNSNGTDLDWIFWKHKPNVDLSSVDWFSIGTRSSTSNPSEIDQMTVSPSALEDVVKWLSPGITYGLAGLGALSLLSTIYKNCLSSKKSATERFGEAPSKKGSI